MTEAEEHAYLAGHRALWQRLLQQGFQELGYYQPETQTARWVLERERAVVALRRICAAHGDNDWPATLDLVDVLANHLEAYLEA